MSEPSSGPRRPFICGVSRSGTTLLATIFDTHPKVSMGYELLPGPIRDLAAFASLLAEGLEAEGPHAKRVGNYLIARDAAPLGKFVKRSGRARVLPDRLLEIVRELHAEGHSELVSLPEQAELCHRIVEAKRALEQTDVSGFKANTSRLADFFEVFPDAYFVFALRDPRDVAASQLQRGFDRTIEQIVKAWCSYLARFLELAEAHPDQTSLVRYEDLVSRPREILEPVFEATGIGFDSEVLRFFESERASIHVTGHVNARQLRSDFFTTSVGRWRGHLTRKQVAQIERQCGKFLADPGHYRSANGGLSGKRLPRPAPNGSELVELGRKLCKQKRLGFRSRKKFYGEEYARLLEPFRSRFRPVRLRDVYVDRAYVGEPVIMIRHDVDHDFESALGMAKWEHERFIASTYCVLHTSWYFGPFEEGRQRYSVELIDFCLKLQELGHEVNLHNNYVTLALRSGQDPASLIGRDLDALRSHGVEIVGSTGHGDVLCRELDFFNLELFSERPWPSKGGARTVENDGFTVALGSVPMAELGLRYEAYDLPREIYVTDSGGRPRVRFRTRGQFGLRRSQHEFPDDHPRVAGILTHPIWWDFDGRPPQDHPLLFERAYEEYGLAKAL